MQPLFPSSAPSESSKLPATEGQAEAVGQIQIGTQLARVYSTAGLQKLESRLAGTRPAASNDLQIRG